MKNIGVIAKLWYDEYGLWDARSIYLKSRLLRKILF